MDLIQVVKGCEIVGAAGAGFPTYAKLSAKSEVFIINACAQCKMCTDMCLRYLMGHKIRLHMVMRNMYRGKEIIEDSEYEIIFGDAATAAENVTELKVGSTVILRPSPKLLENLL